MAIEQPNFLFTRVAAADLSSYQYRLVKIDANGQAALCGAGEKAAGVLQNKPASGEEASIMSEGISKIVAGAAITGGATIASDANGKAVTATTGDEQEGEMLEAAGADGEIRSVLLKSRGPSA